MVVDCVVVAGALVVVVVAWRVVVVTSADADDVTSGPGVLSAGPTVVESAELLHPASSARTVSPRRTGPGGGKLLVRSTTQLSLREHSSSEQGYRPSTTKAVPVRFEHFAD